MIDIKTFAVKKAAAKTSPYVYYGSSGGGFGNNTSSNVAGKIEGHYLWGQYFDATQDINGDLTSNGKITSQRLKFIDGTGNTLTLQDFTASTASIISLSSTTINNSGNFFNGGSIENKGDLFNDGDITNKGDINNLGKITTDQIQAVSGYIQTLLGVDWTVENLTVTKAARFFKLIIDEIKATQGAVIVTPANAKIDKVTQSGNNYTCFFRTTDPTTKKEIYNNFEVNDQVVCQTFNAATGTSYNVSNKFYWTLVYETGTTTVDNVSYHYVKLHYADRDPKSNGVPQAGDEIVLLGNRNDASRQNAIVISAYNSQFLDAGLKAPSIVQYSGIKDYNLSSHRLNIISNGLNSFKGAFTTTDGKDVKQSFDTISGTVTTHTTNIASLSATCTGLTSTVQSHTNSINTINTNVSNVSGQVSTNTTNISNLQQTASSLTSDISSVEKKVETVSGSVTTANGNIATISGNVTTNTNNISNLQQTASSLTSSISSTTTKVETVSGQVTTLDGTVKNVSGQVVTNTTDISNLKQTSSSLTSSIQSIKNDVLQSQSLIEQTADNIRLEVMSCGVDIDNKRIKLNGDTLIEGNLTVQGDGVGFTLQGASGTTQIISDSIGRWSKFSATTQVNVSKTTSKIYTVGTYNSNGKYQHTPTFTYEIGEIESGKILTLKSFETSTNPTTTTSVNNTFEIYVNDVLNKSIDIANLRNTGWNYNYTLTSTGNVTIKRKVKLITTSTSNYQWTTILNVSYPTNAYSKIAYDGMGFNLGNGNHIFCNSEDGVRIGNTNYNQVYTSSGITTNIQTGSTFNDNGTSRKDTCSVYEPLGNAIPLGISRVRRIGSGGIFYLQPTDKIISVITTDNHSYIYIMLGLPAKRAGWHVTLLNAENVNVVADSTGTTNAQKLNASHVHNLYCDGVYWYYEGRGRTVQFSTGSTHAYG